MKKATSSSTRMRTFQMFISVAVMVALATPGSVAGRPVHTAHPRHILQEDGSGATITEPVDVSAAPPGDVIKLGKSTIELALDLSSEYVLGVDEDSGATPSAPGHLRRLLAASSVSVAKCTTNTFPFRCPAPQSDAALGSVVWVSPGSTPLNTLTTGTFNRITLPATTWTQAQLAPNVRLVVGVRGVDAGFAPNVTSGNSTRQQYVGTIANTGDGSALASGNSSSAVHTYWIPRSYVAAPGATTVRLTFRSDYNGNGFTRSMYLDWVQLDFSDRTPPAITLPTVPNTMAIGPSTPVSWAAPTASDAVTPGVIPVACNATSGQGFRPGSTVVACSATDEAGNIGHNSFVVTVVKPDWCLM